MYEFLAVVPTSRLYKILSRSTGLDDSWLSEQARDNLYLAIFSKYGFDFLREESARIALIECLPEENIFSLAEACGAKTHGKSYDLAIRLGQLSWRSGSPIVSALCRLLDIPPDYLPSSAMSQSAISLLRSRKRLPSLFDFQQEVKDSVEQFLISARKRALIQMPTGSGKTRTTMECVVNFVTSHRLEIGVATVCWLAHSQELCDQALECFGDVWSESGIGSIKVARFWANNRVDFPDMIDSFVVSTFGKLFNLYKKRELSNELLEYAKHLDLLVIDEAHKALAPSVKALVRFLFLANPNLKVIGLSATPGRSAELLGDNAALADLFDKNLIRSSVLGATPIQNLQDRGVLAELDRIEVSSGLSLNNAEVGENDESGYDINSKILKVLSENSRRNEVILELLQKLASSNKSVLVFSCTSLHSEQLAFSLAMAGVPAASITYKTNSVARSKIIQSFRDRTTKVLVNYGVLTTGFDAPGIDAVVITRPTTSIVLYSQMLGRGLRGPSVGGAKKCEVIDIKDNFENFGDLDDVYNYFSDYWVSH